MAKKRIRVVDDEDYNRQTLAEILDDEGYDVTPARSGEDAVAQMRGVPPDLMQTDLWMPGMNGLDLLAHVRAHYPGTAVLLLTADAGDAHEGALDAADGILSKPIEIDDMLQRIAAVLHCNHLETR